MDTDQSAPATPAQPESLIERDGTIYHMLGTAHVSKASAERVAELLQTEQFDAVGVELCAYRNDVMKNPDAIREMDLFRAIREGRAGMVAASLVLGSYQRKIAKQFGIEPGAEMKTAIDIAEKQNIPYWLIDRDVGMTLKRARAAVGWWERLKITAGLIASVFDDTEIQEADVEKLKQGDLLESSFTEFAKGSPALYLSLITERDEFMAAKIRERAAAERPKRVLIVIGAGHLEGLKRQLEDQVTAPQAIVERLSLEPPKSNLGKWFAWLLIAFVIFGFFWGFSHSSQLGWSMIAQWVLITGMLGAIGAAAAGAHPLSVLSAFVASPLTPLHPALSSGMVSGAVELWLRKPRVGDFETLKDDINALRGWWRNRVARVFLVLMLTSLGTAIGVWIAGIRIVSNIPG